MLISTGTQHIELLCSFQNVNSLTRYSTCIFHKSHLTGLVIILNTLLKLKKSRNHKYQLDFISECQSIHSMGENTGFGRYYNTHKLWKIKT